MSNGQWVIISFVRSAVARVYLLWFYQASHLPCESTLHTQIHKLSHNMSVALLQAAAVHPLHEGAVHHSLSGKSEKTWWGLELTKNELNDWKYNN